MLLHLLDNVCLLRLCFCCSRPDNFNLRQSKGLSLSVGCFVSKWRFSLHGFMLSFASRSAHMTHWAAVQHLSQPP